MEAEGPSAAKQNLGLQSGGAAASEPLGGSHSFPPTAERRFSTQNEAMCSEGCVTNEFLDSLKLRWNKE